VDVGAAPAARDEVRGNEGLAELLRELEGAETVEEKERVLEKVQSQRLSGRVARESRLDGPIPRVLVSVLRDGSSVFQKAAASILERMSRREEEDGVLLEAGAVDAAIQVWRSRALWGVRLRACSLLDSLVEKSEEMKARARALDICRLAVESVREELAADPDDSEPFVSRVRPTLQLICSLTSGPVASGPAPEFAEAGAIPLLAGLLPVLMERDAGRPGEDDDVAWESETREREKTLATALWALENLGWHRNVRQQLYREEHGVLDRVLQLATTRAERGMVFLHAVGVLQVFARGDPFGERIAAAPGLLQRLVRGLGGREGDEEEEEEEEGEGEVAVLGAGGDLVAVCAEVVRHLTFHEDIAAELIHEGVVAKLAALLHVESQGTLFNVVGAFRHLLFGEREVRSRVLLDCPALPERMVELLEVPAEDVRAVAVGVLAELMIRDDEADVADVVRDRILDLGAIPRLVDLLKDDDDEVRQRAASALSSLMHRSPVRRMAVISCGPVPAVARFLDVDASPVGLRDALDVLVQCVKHGEAEVEREVDADAPAMAARMARLSKNGDRRVVGLTCIAVRWIATTSRLMRTRLGSSADLRRRLLSLLEMADEDEDLCADACGAVALLLSEHEANRAAFDRDGVLERVVPLLEVPSSTIREFAAGALWNFAGSEARRAAVVAAGALPKLVAMTRAGEDRSVREGAVAMGALHALAEDNDERGVELVQLGIIPDAIRLVRRGDPAAVREGGALLWSLASLAPLDIIRAGGVSVAATRLSDALEQDDEETAKNFAILLCILAFVPDAAPALPHAVLPLVDYLVRIDPEMQVGMFGALRSLVLHPPCAELLLAEPCREKLQRLRDVSRHARVRQGVVELLDTAEGARHPAAAAAHPAVPAADDVVPERPEADSDDDEDDQGIHINDAGQRPDSPGGAPLPSV
jgi:hypothetical protein